MDSDYNGVVLLHIGLKLTSTMIKDWKITKTTYDTLVQCIREQDKDILELLKAQTSETQLGKKVEMEVLLRKAGEDRWGRKLKIVKGIVSDLHEEVRNKEKAIQKLEVTNDRLVKAGSLSALKVAQTQERMQGKLEAEKSELEKAHKLECDRLRLEAQQTEANLAEQISEARQTLDRQFTEITQKLDELRKESQQEKEAIMQKYQAESTLLAEQVSELKLELQYMKLKEMKRQQVESARVTECGPNEASREFVKPENGIELIGRLDTVEALEQHFTRIFKSMKKNGLVLDVQQLEADGKLRKRIRVE